MKLPKSLIIGGVKWKVVIKKLSSGGAFYWHNHLIEISKKHTDERRFQALIHEIVEVILANNIMRYQKGWASAPDNGDYIFVFNHDQFEVFTDELSGVLKQFMRPQ